MLCLTSATERLCRFPGRHLALLLIVAWTNILLVSKSMSQEIDIGIEILFDTMENPNYSGFSLNSSSFITSPNPDDVSDISYEANSIAGNPTPSFSIFHQHEVNRDLGGLPLNGEGSTFLQSLFLQETFTYNPLNDGAFSSLSFSLDINLPSPVGSAIVDQVFFTVRDQNFFSASGFTPVTGQNTGWQTITVSGLDSADFLNSHDFSGPLDLSFGFGFISQGDVTSGAESLPIAVDNFRVSITAVPEPSTFLLLTPVALGVVARLRLRKALSTT